MQDNVPYMLPAYQEHAFNCPYCHAYAKMSWGDARTSWSTGGGAVVDEISFAYCTHCNEWSVWHTGEMIYPKKITVEAPNSDLPEDVIVDYKEAASILQDSPRGSAAMMRLAIQKLCDSLVDSKDDLNTKIGALVKSGLDKRIQMSLDAVRVIGNEAVHPGQIDIKDSPQIAHQLFKLVNLIGRRMISEPAEVDEIYASLPEEKLKGIEARDKK